MIKVINNDNQEIAQIKEIKRAVEKYYQTLYDTKISPPPGKEEVNRVTVRNVGSEEIPDVTTDEIINALQHIQNNKEPGDDEITIKMIKYGYR